MCAALFPDVTDEIVQEIQKSATVILNFEGLLENFDTPYKIFVWLEVFYLPPSIPHLMCLYQIKKLMHPNSRNAKMDFNENNESGRFKQSLKNLEEKFPLSFLLQQG